MLEPVAQIKVDPEHPLLVFGGPYSNEQATRALMEQATARSVPVSNIICTGDIVAYAAAPETVSTLIREWGIRTIQGNCEEQLATDAPDCGCGFDDGSACDLLSQSWYSFARGAISPVTRDWMSKLPKRLSFRYRDKTLAVIHGSAHTINRFIFPSTDRAEKAAEIDALHADIVLAGHSGIPFVQRLANGTWFNPGVIGMPANDGTPDGWFGIIDTDLNPTLHRLVYDAQDAAADLRKSAAPNAYAKALETGLWPSLDVLPAAEQANTGKALSAHANALENLA